ncbi:MAG TPA: DNA methyltransferase [Tepidisphaeraceae bacterium]|jgi:predicted nucleotidyltransferase|nr:DNA methyltransferase [Tepidisphaeraceae bacterium]
MTHRAGTLTPDEFVQKWTDAQLSERAASHEHFIDLCRLLDEPTPAGADSTGDDYCFEKHVKVVGSASKGSKGDHGFVDVWKRGRFAWEYKGKDRYKSLEEAYRQLYQYRDDLDNPPISIVCDIRTTEIRTHFAGYPTQRIVLKLEQIPANLGLLKRVFTDPDSFRRTQKTTETVTTELAEEFGDLANKLIERYPPDALQLWESAGSPVAHFLMKVMFCLFAEDVKLLPDQAFTKIINLCLMNPERFQPLADQLFKLMRKGGEFGFDKIPYFNGGLFDDAPALPLKHGDLVALRRVAGDGQNWAGVEPSIFGTLFERILDPRKRAQIGAHYTSKADILLVIEPVIMAPLRRRWQQVQDELKDAIDKHDAEKDRKRRDVLSAPIKVAVESFRQFLRKQRILDPACGSGNFLYVALQQLLDLEDEVVRFCARRDIYVDPIPRVRPSQLHGIEINLYAAELAQVVIWIGYLQWLHVHGIEDPKTPILDKLDTVEHRDAILDLSNKKLPVPAQWPRVDFIVGNPPFLGSKMFRRFGLTDDYLRALFRSYDLPKTSDLCCYWFDKARGLIEEFDTIRVGLLATQGIRGGDNRTVLERIKEFGDIFNAWEDKEWPLDGAMVHVSIVCFDDGTETTHNLNGIPVSEINADLSTGVSTTGIRSLTENEGICFMGTTKGGGFDLSPAEARSLFSEPNSNGASTLDVVRPWINGSDVNGRRRGMFIIDYGCEPNLQAATGYESAFKYVETTVKPERINNRRASYAENWWLHVEPRPALRNATQTLDRFIVTTRVSKHRIFAWFANPTLPDSATFAFARADDYAFGILQSSLHEAWARRMGTQLREEESGFRYTPSSCFETFPLPWSPGKEDTKHPAYLRVAAAAKALNEQRERWLNPPEWIEPLAAKIDAADAFDDVPAEARALVRQSAIMAAAAKDARLKKRTLTNLYNERPTWLKLAHEQIDRSVLAAYAAVDTEGDWSEDWAEVWTDTGAGQPLSLEHPLRARRTDVDQKVLANFLRLNHLRAGLPLNGLIGRTGVIGTPREGRVVDDPKLAKAMQEYRDGLSDLYDPGRKESPEPGPLDDPKKRPRLDKVVLFGSRARGTASPGSDADVLIVLNGPFDHAREIRRTSKLTADISLQHGVAINRIIMNQKDALKTGPLQANISKDAIIL